jgi:hypothetical protein
MFDWQIIIAAITIMAASVYVGWRGWLRISSLKPNRKMPGQSCSGGCGCSSTKPLVNKSHSIITKRKLSQR